MSTESLSSTAIGQDILLEAGTNEVEVLVFCIDDERYGVNVAKVREVIQLPVVKPLPRSSVFLDGMITLRDEVIPLFSLRNYFDLPSAPTEMEENVLVTEFSNLRAAFRVDRVDRIYRVSYKSIQGVPAAAGDGDSAITAMVRLGDELIMMVDFERFIMTVGGVQDFEKYETRDVDSAFKRQNIHVLHVEDSAFMRMTIDKALKKSGYTHLSIHNDGEEAWKWLEKHATEDGGPPVDVVITDLEMPKMDGLHLTKKIKDHPVLKSLPVIVFSSLISPDNQKKCLAVGADAQITKPELGSLVETIDKLLQR